MAEEKQFYVIIGKKTPLSSARSKLVKYHLINQRRVSNERIFEFVDEEVSLDNAKDMILECKNTLKDITIILLPINTRTESDGKTIKDETFKKNLLDKHPKCYFYNEFLTLPNSA